MSEMTLEIDGRPVVAAADASLLEAARGAGIDIPTLCYDERLAPHGGCRLCMVEVEARGRKNLVAACTYPARDGLVVTTRSAQIDTIRRVLTEQLLAYAPESGVLKALAATYGADPDRYESEPSFCILCGLCVRYCAEIKQQHAIGFVSRGPEREIGFIPELAAQHCWECKECFPLCPTSALQAAFVLVRSLTGAGSQAASVA